MMSRRPPDFICIGAQKAGTTWLHENLGQHPEVWLPPVKELHFLDHQPPPLLKRLFSKASHHRLARSYLYERIGAVLRGAAAASLQPALMIALGRRDWAWYERLFAQAGNRIAGEICPGYARLSSEAVAEIASRYPRLKIIYLLRDPVDRAWSSVAMHFRKDGTGLVSDVDETAVLSQLRKPKSFGHCAYAQNISSWTAHFPPEQIYFGFFDRIREAPDEYLAEVLAFLGANENFAARNASAPVNKGKGEQVYPQLERRIAELLLPETEYLDRHFANPYTRRWLAHAQLIMANDEAAKPRQ